jgi:hypothetical protein
MHHKCNVFQRIATENPHPKYFSCKTYSAGKCSIRLNESRASAMALIAEVAFSFPLLSLSVRLCDFCAFLEVFRL